ncbi:MAG: hypothetical protein ACJ75B_20415 [Flavisolibacter sp.]
MTEVEAVELLRHHSYNHDDLQHPKTEKGFLGMLRPFDGQLYEDNFHELMTILKILKQHFRDDKIDRQIISSFWGICYFSKAWGLEAEGMLRRNNLLSDDQIKKLSVWIDCISYAVMGLLDGMDDKHAFEPYTLYLSDQGH